MFKKLALVAAVFAASASASVFAVDASNVEKVVALQDGTSVYIFKDGNMAMEDKLGRTVAMNEGHVMQTTDGKSIAMVGDEVARLSAIRKTELGGGE
ncbi:MAG: CopK family periplasmic copper-binding protein [Ramlibacter sp.]